MPMFRTLIIAVCLAGCPSRPAPEPQKQSRSPAPLSDEQKVWVKECALYCRISSPQVVGSCIGIARDLRQQGVFESEGTD